MLCLIAISNDVVWHVVLIYDARRFGSASALMLVDLELIREIH